MPYRYAWKPPYFPSLKIHGSSGCICGFLTLMVCLFRVTGCSKCHGSPMPGISASQPISVSGIGVNQPDSTKKWPAGLLPWGSTAQSCLASICPFQPSCAILDLVPVAVPCHHPPPAGLAAQPFNARQESHLWAVTQLPNYFRCVDFKHTHKQLLCLRATRPSATIVGMDMLLWSQAGPGWCQQEMFCTTCPGRLGIAP